MIESNAAFVTRMILRLHCLKSFIEAPQYLQTSGLSCLINPIRANLGFDQVKSWDSGDEYIIEQDRDAEGRLSSQD